MPAVEAEYWVRSGLPFGSSQTAHPRFRQRWQSSEEFYVPAGKPDQPVFFDEIEGSGLPAKFGMDVVPGLEVAEEKEDGGE